MPPDEFIPLFERTGLGCRLGLAGISSRLRPYPGSSWTRENTRSSSPATSRACTCENDAFPETVKSIVDGFGVPIELLELELTENIVMEDLERAERLCRRLKDLGFRIAIDDFGSGYSSLGTLQNLPIDVLKLDRSFLMSSESGERCKAILDAWCPSPTSWP